MGYNLHSCCHKCQEKIMHFRRKENETILDFYKKHADCAKYNKNNVETILDQNGPDVNWIDLYKEIEL
jgi:hypothetical protein